MVYIHERDRRKKRLYQKDQEGSCLLEDGEITEQHGEITEQQGVPVGTLFSLQKDQEKGETS